MELKFGIYPLHNRGTFGNREIGKGTLEGASVDEIKEKAIEIANSKEKVMGYLYDLPKQYYRGKFRIDIDNGGKVIRIKSDENKKNSNNKNNKSMSKKDFKNPILNILDKKPETPQNYEEEETATSQESPKKVGRPKKDRSQESENETEPRTYKLKNEILQKVKLVALKTGRTQTEVVEYALTELIERYEKKNGILDVTEAQKSFEEFF